MMDDDPRDLAAQAEYHRQVESTNPEQRSAALYWPCAFQASLATHGADVSDYLALLELLDTALDEYDGKLEAEMAPTVH